MSTKIPNIVQNVIRRGTKLVATMGPATSSPEVLRSLVYEGLDVARLNFSHGSHAYHKTVIDNLRAIEHDVKRPIAILQDLCGPKIRTTPLKDSKSPIVLKTGQDFTIVSRSDVLGEGSRTGTIYTSLAKDVAIGDRILLSDGMLGLKVVGKQQDEILCKVEHGGILKGSQGINCPNTNLSTESVTAKDIQDLEFGLHSGVDYVAISFVRSAEDVMVVKQHMDRLKIRVPVIAKIELPQAVSNINAICEASEGIMVARGDLGVELPAEQVPVVQKRVIASANQAGIPVIVATQMLESMIKSPRPTRAEVSDVCNAIYDGADACMLSAETSVGDFPVESVRMMASISSVANQNKDVDATISIQQQKGFGFDITSTRHHRQSVAVARAAVTMSSTLNAAAIGVFTYSGRTARYISAMRPTSPVIALTMSQSVARQLNLLKNVIAFKVPECLHLLHMTKLFDEIIEENGIAKEGDHVIITGGHPLNFYSATNFLKLMQVGQDRQLFELPMA